MRIPTGFLWLSALASLPALAFPDGALAPPAADLQRYLSDRVFTAKLADGSSWRLQYRADGFFFIDTSGGFNGSGQWRAEDGRVCSRLRTQPYSCNDVRMLSDQLHLRRDSGEVIQLVPQ